jgi:hypothetical protein
MKSLIMLLLLVPGAFACSCLQPAPPLKALAESDAVFSGTVVSLSEPMLPTSSADLMSVEFDVAQVWKGDISQKEEIHTALSSASCGFNFEAGRDYIVYANEYGGRLQASLCSRTSLLSDAQEDLQALGAGKAALVAQDTSPVVIGLYWAGAFLILIIAAAAVLKKK